MISCPSPSEVTIFDKDTGRFILLNMANQEQTELSIAEVNAFSEKLKQLSNKQKDPLSKFFADPKFEERFQATNGELTLSSPWVTYRLVTAAAKNPAVSAQYRDFSDGYARLNALLNPGSRPPSARLQVNEALARHQVIAREVNLTMTSVKNNVSQKTVLRSEHDFTQNLTASDVERIQNAAQGQRQIQIGILRSLWEKSEVGTLGKKLVKMG